MTRDDLIDEEGENQAIRAFLMLYSGGSGEQVKIADMRQHLKRSGFDGCWPEWVDFPDGILGLTKSGAQSWVRHLFELEAQFAASPTLPSVQEVPNIKPWQQRKTEAMMSQNWASTDDQVYKDAELSEYRALLAQLKGTK